MFLADVIGTVVTPVQHPHLAAKRLLHLRLLTPDGRPTGKARVGIDGCGAGEGDRVIVLDEGNGGRQLTGIPNAPIKPIVVGVVDYLEDADGALAYAHTDRPPLGALDGSEDDA